MVGIPFGLFNKFRATKFYEYHYFYNYGICPHVAILWDKNVPDNYRKLEHASKMFIIVISMNYSYYYLLLKDSSTRFPALTNNIFILKLAPHNSGGCFCKLIANYFFAMNLLSMKQVHIP